MIPAQAGLVFDNNWDPSLTANLSSTEKLQWQNAITYAEGVYSSLFTNSITVNVTFKAAPGTAILGESSATLDRPFTYSQVKSALSANATSSVQQTADANLPATDPTGGASFVFATSEAKALGLMGANGTASDGTITFGAGYTYAFDPNNRAVPGDYDFIGVAEHEISEVMGRFGMLGLLLGSPSVPTYDALDLFGYSAPGQLSLNPTNTGAYFSIDGGVTDLMAYNGPGNGGDLRDWAGGTNDAFNAFTGSGVENDISTVDLTEMNVLGYQLAAVATPEPSSMVPTILILGAFFAWRRRRTVAD